MRLGIDLGGTKISGVVLDDSAAGPAAVRVHLRTPTPRDDYDGTVRAVAALVQALAAEAGLPRDAPVGIGIPGTVSPRTGLVRNANSTWLIGRALDRDLESALGRRVRTANDANCFALSEATDGAAADVATSFGVILGTGVGGGVVVDGKLLSGAQGIAGEWGHTPLPAPRPDWGEVPGPACWCGRRGCIETYLCGPAFAADAGLGLDGAGTAAAAAEGAPAAVAALDRYVDRLGRALGAVVNLLDPEAIVLGGGVSATPALYDRLPAAAAPHVFSDSPIVPPILPAAHGPDGGVRGAARLWPEDSDGRP